MAKRLHVEEAWEWGDFSLSTRAKAEHKVFKAKNNNNYTLGQVLKWPCWFFSMLGNRVGFVGFYRKSLSKVEHGLEIIPKNSELTSTSTPKKTKTHCHHLERSTESICSSLNWRIASTAIISFVMEEDKKRPWEVPEVSRQDSPHFTLNIQACCYSEITLIVAQSCFQ